MAHADLARTRTSIVHQQCGSGPPAILHARGERVSWRACWRGVTVGVSMKLSLFCCRHTTYVLLLLLASAVAPALASGSCAASIPAQPLKNIIGGNMKILSVPSATACQTLCCDMNAAGAAQRCGGFVWASASKDSLCPSTPTVGGCCYLKQPGCSAPQNKTAVANFTATTLVAGVAPRQPPPPPPPFPPPPANFPGRPPQPIIHYTPPPWRGQTTGGDIAGALLHPVTQAWHVMPLSHVGWAHVTSTDLVSWRYAGNTTTGGGPRFESGGMIYDHKRNLTVAFANSPTDAAETADVDLALGSFQSPTTLFSSSDPLNKKKPMGCWDPVMWWDERDELYYSATACGHCDPGVEKWQTGHGIGCSGGEGLEIYWSSPVISGPGASWKLLNTTFLEIHEAAVPRVGSWRRPHEFVTPDFFPLPQAPETGGFHARANATESWGFLTTSYGSMKYTGLPTPNSAETDDLCYGTPHSSTCCSFTLLLSRSRFLCFLSERRAGVCRLR